MKSLLIVVLIISLYFLPIQAVQAGSNIFNPFEVVTALFQIATTIVVAVASPLSFISPTIMTLGLILISPDIVTGNWVLCQVMGIDGPIFTNCDPNDPSANPIIISSENVDCAYQYRPTFYIPQFFNGYTTTPVLHTECTDMGEGGTYCVDVPVYDSSGNPTYQTSYTTINNDTFDSDTGKERKISIYRFEIPTNVDQATLNNWYFNIKNNAGNGFLLTLGYTTPADTATGASEYTYEPYYHTSGVPPKLIRTLFYSEECTGNVCNKLTDGSVPENSYAVYVAKMEGPYVSSITGLNKFLNNDNNANYAIFPDPSVGLGNAIVGPIKTGSCPPPKYKCSDTGCIQSSYGPYTTPNCDNKCASPAYKCEGTICVRDDINGTYTESYCNGCPLTPPPPITTPLPVEIRYKCDIANNCVSDNGDGSGNYYDSNCYNACAPLQSSCICYGWYDESCGGGGCPATSMHQTQICINPLDLSSGCGPESQCVVDASCVLPAGSFLNNAACLGINAPDSVSVNQAFSASVTMNNTGSGTWRSDATPHKLGSQNPRDNLNWGLSRVSLPWSIGPGWSAVFNFNATAPSSPGTYPFYWQMVEDGVEWFGSTCAKIITVQSAPPPAACPDGICNGTENPNTCLQDCPAVCPDTYCTAPAENCNTCVSDCGACTLNANFTASPISGSQPLPVTLTADITGGTATGNINYSFWWNCIEFCSSVADCAAACGDPTNSANGAKFDNVLDDPKTVNHTYTSSGTFTPKVIVERDTAPAIAKTATVTIGCNTACSSWTACDFVCDGTPGTQSCTDTSSCEYGKPPRDCNTPLFSFKPASGIYVNIVKNSTSPVTSTKTTISSDLYYCYNKEVTLSQTSTPALPAGTTFNYAKKLNSVNSYRNDFTITVPATTPAGIYTVKITGIDSDGYGDNSPLSITFTVNIKDPNFIEF